MGQVSTIVTTRWTARYIIQHRRDFSDVVVKHAKLLEDSGDGDFIFASEGEHHQITDRPYSVWEPADGGNRVVLYIE